MTAFKYNVGLNWVADRKGELHSTELNDKIEVATPPEFPGGIENIWSPEHLFTASVVSCFMTTFLAIAENSKLKFKHFSCDSEGILDKADGKFKMTEVILKPKLLILMEEDREKALKVLDKAERACLITNSISSEVKMNPDVQVLLPVN
ncbi:OsmC family protein [Salegentibacter chungangensis]|uniref:OsmC family protein n=1 Tax=Salegentibacter chungangensis TaxID=1335724 RepID=A0ABW3NVP2_9FLAO